MKKVRIFFSKSNQLAYRLKMGHRVKAIRERLDKIAADKAKFLLSDHPAELPLELRERGQTHSFMRADDTIGRKDDKKKIVQLLLESKPKENVSVVPIVGIGGLGKTTLAKMVFNDQDIREHFEKKMWVCVSEKFELKVIVEKIIEAATEEKPDKDLQMETLQDRLRHSINGRKYLLVLDDVWNEDRGMWFSLKSLLLDGARGSCIVITTRKEAVARITEPVSSHVLQGLSKSDSWSLLKKMAFVEESPEYNDSRLEAIGMDIVEKCKGVPLALKMIGRVLFNRTEEEWLRVKNNVRKYITEQETGIMPILKLSYDHLRPHLRQCFAYCSLIPKDTEFQVEELIINWMAHDFIQPLSGDDDLEGAGREYFKDLLWKSFFQVVKEDGSGNVITVTMHDLMHDLACSVAGAECCIASLETDNVNERTGHVLFENKFDSSWKISSSLRKANRLRTFSPMRGVSLNLSTCSALISDFKYLRVLKLSNSDIERLPRSVGKLKHLRSLDLSGNKVIRRLPSSLSTLQNLLNLELNRCSRLKELPRETRKLVKLRHLRVGACEQLCYMPRELGQLTSLRTLSNFVVGKRGRQVGELGELNGLKKLEGHLHVSSLQNAIPQLGSNYLKEKLNLKSLRLSWSRREEDEEDDVINLNDEMVFECLQPHPNLQKLWVDRYPGSKIPSWLPSITNLTELHLLRCGKCKHLPPLHQLPSLKVLELLKLEALENMSETEMQKELRSAESTTIFLPSLEKLKIGYCKNLKEWWRGDFSEALNAQLPWFPCLSALYITSCPNLNSMPLFPLVRELSLTDTNWKPLIQPTMKMKRTTSEAPSSSSSSSSSIFHPFPELEYLHLQDIEYLDSLPEEFLQNQTSLSYMCIARCINLTSMPEGMHRLMSLKELNIYGCHQLSERCRRGVGVDWPNIAHIERISIDDM